MIRFTAVLSANPAPASAKTRPRQTLRFGDFASEIAGSLLTIVLIDNEKGCRWKGREVPISWPTEEVGVAVQGDDQVTTAQWATMSSQARW